MARKITCIHCGTTRLVSKTSNYTGVDFYKKTKKFRARIRDNKGNNQHLGFFDSELKASISYDDFIINNGLINRPLNHPNRINRWS